MIFSFSFYLARSDNHGGDARITLQNIYRCRKKSFLTKSCCTRYTSTSQLGEYIYINCHKTILVWHILDCNKPDFLFMCLRSRPDQFLLLN